jgi:hypothetical protein
MNKKAQGLSITTVVVAILAILVLVVLFYIFTTKTGGLSRQLITCPGDCADSAAACGKYGGVELPEQTTGKYITKQGNTCNVCCSVLFPTDAPERLKE